MYLDRYYFILIIPAMLIGLWAQFNVKSTFSRYSRELSKRGITGAEAARVILDRNGLQHVKVEAIAGSLTDHFDPRSNVIRLSSDVYGKTNVAAIGVAAHEAGHAIQAGVSYTPMKIRAAIIPITNIGSAAAIPIAMLGLFAGIGFLVDIGVVLFSAVVLFQLVTLPVEFNASSRALKALEPSGLLDKGEVADAKKVLTAAGLTYVAALVSSLATLLRLILLSRRNDR